MSGGQGEGERADAAAQRPAGGHRWLWRTGLVVAVAAAIGLLLIARRQEGIPPLLPQSRRLVGLPQGPGAIDYQWMDARTVLASRSRVNDVGPERLVRVDTQTGRETPYPVLSRQLADEHPCLFRLAPETGLVLWWADMDNGWGPDGRAGPTTPRCFVAPLAGPQRIVSRAAGGIALRPFWLPGGRRWVAVERRQGADWLVVRDAEGTAAPRWLVKLAGRSMLGGVTSRGEAVCWRWGPAGYPIIGRYALEPTPGLAQEWTFDPGGPLEVIHLAVSPVGDRIAIEATPELPRDNWPVRLAASLMPWAEPAHAHTGLLYVARLDGTGVRRIGGGDCYPAMLSWTPDGRCITFTAREALWAVSP